MRTALVRVPEKDAIFEAVEMPPRPRFDIDAQSFGTLCQELGV
jgi:hypothetical protein